MTTTPSPTSGKATNQTPKETPRDFYPDFAKGGGLLPVIVQCATSKRVLMLAYMNETAFQKSLETGEAHYWSRSREALWHKGESSGHVQKIQSIQLDCDNDTLLLLITQIGGAACHTGRESCFYRELKDNTVTECSPMIFDPTEVYSR